MGSIVKALGGIFKGFKKPWEITGLTSTVDYLEYMPSASDYRKHSPGSQPVSAIVPHDIPALVYNTRYYGRDFRRNNKYTARVVDRTPLDVDKLVASMPLTPEDIKFSPASGGGGGAGGGGGGLNDGDELDVAVFRFTLGIPGFDDSLVPRVVGGAAAALLALNHALGAQPVPPAQERAEFLCALLVALCVVTPEIEERLKQVLPGRGRQQAAEAVDGAARVFVLAERLPEADKRELAWLTFALLKNANCCGVVVARGGGEVVAARGAIGSGAAGGASGSGGSGGGGAVLDAAAKDLARGAAASADVAAVLRGERQQLWLPDRAAMARAGVDGWAVVPRGAQSLLLQHVAGGGALVVLGDRPRALPGKDRSWVAALARKL